MKIAFDPDDYEPLIQRVVEQTVATLEADRASVGDKFTYTEPEAARLLGLNERQLAGERRRGRIMASAIVGRRIRYLRSDLIEYMQSRRWSKRDD